MRIEVTGEIGAPADRVWEVIADVERWHEWTASITGIEFQTKGKLGPLSSARVRQPGFPPAVWRVTVFQPGRSFSWQNRNPGITSTGVHTVDSAGPGRSLATLSIEQTGLLAPLINALWGKRTREYVAMELAGLRRRCEQAAGS